MTNINWGSLFWTGRTFHIPRFPHPRTNDENDKRGRKSTNPHLFHWYVQTHGNILNRLAIITNNAHTACNRLGRYRMIAGNHDDFNTSTTTLAHGVRYGGARWIDHGHEADETQFLQWEVWIFGVEFKAFRELVFVQLQSNENLKLG